MSETNIIDWSTDDALVRRHGEAFKQLCSTGCPRDQIMAILTIDANDYDKLMANESIKNHIIKAEQSRLETNQTFDANWDTLENEAMNVVLAELQSRGCDPMYALKAAAVANKAVRRRREEAKNLIHAKSLEALGKSTTNNIQIVMPSVMYDKLANQNASEIMQSIAKQKQLLESSKLQAVADASTVKEVMESNRGIIEGQVILPTNMDDFVTRLGKSATPLGFESFDDQNRTVDLDSLSTGDWFNDKSK